MKLTSIPRCSGEREVVREETYTEESMNGRILGGLWWEEEESRKRAEGGYFVHQESGVEAEYVCYLMSPLTKLPLEYKKGKTRIKSKMRNSSKTYSLPIQPTIHNHHQIISTYQHEYFPDLLIFFLI